MFKWYLVENYIKENKIDEMAFALQSFTNVKVLNKLRKNDCDLNFYFLDIVNIAKVLKKHPCQLFDWDK